MIGLLQAKSPNSMVWCAASLCGLRVSIQRELVLLDWNLDFDQVGPTRSGSEVLVFINHVEMEGDDSTSVRHMDCGLPIGSGKIHEEPNTRCAERSMSVPKTKSHEDRLIKRAGFQEIRGQV